MELHELTAREQARLVQAREVSPVDLVEHHLRRITDLNERIGAFTTVAADQARAAAAAAEKAVLAGDVAAGETPLYGVPTAVKDLNAMAGVRTTFGSAAFPDMVPEFDDNVTALLRRGMIVLGKTNTPEFGAGCYTEPEVAPPARTPWAPELSAGGSSGGAGAAVAAALLPVAHGSDSAGSIRIPASACGVVGLKPTRGRISSGPISGEVTGLFGNGVLARDVLDAAAMLEILAVPMPGDPWRIPDAPGRFVETAERFDRKLRIGRYVTPPVPGTPVAPECVAAWEDASRLLADLGHEVEDIPCPFPAEVEPLFVVLFATTAAMLPLGAEQQQALRPLTRWLRGLGEQVSGPQLMGAVTQIQQMSRRVVAATAGYDAVLTPTLAQPPAPVGFFRDDDDPAADFERQKRFSPFAATANLTGQPSISLPLFWTEDGLPIGVMLSAAAGAEGTLLGLGAQLQAARPWTERRPPVW